MKISARSIAWRDSTSHRTFKSLSIMTSTLHHSTGKYKNKDVNLVTYIVTLPTFEHKPNNTRRVPILDLRDSYSCLFPIQTICSVLGRTWKVLPPTHLQNWFTGETYTFHKSFTSTLDKRSHQQLICGTVTSGEGSNESQIILYMKWRLNTIKAFVGCLAVHINNCFSPQPPNLEKHKSHSIKW